MKGVSENMQFSGKVNLEQMMLLFHRVVASLDMENINVSPCKQRCDLL